MCLRPRGASGWGLRALALTVSVAVLGCGGGGGTGNVSGKVTYNGKALKGGRVTYSVGPKSVVSDIKEDGSYTAENVPVGKAKILVETSYLQQMSKMPAYKPPKDAPVPEGYKMGGDPAAKKQFVKIPDKYEMAEETPLTYEVKKGDQTHDIQLQ